MQVTILDAALHHVLAQMLVEFELVANDQTQSNQVVVFKNAQHEFNELKRDLVKFDLSFFFELQINNFFRLLTDVQWLKFLFDFWAKQTDVIDNLLNDFIFNLLVLCYKSDVFASFYTAVETQNRKIILIIARDYRKVRWLVQLAAEDRLQNRNTMGILQKLIVRIILGQMVKVSNWNCKLFKISFMSWFLFLLQWQLVVA